jgi:hypothetical protein
MQQAFDYQIRARHGSERFIVRLHRPFTGVGLGEAAYTDIAKSVFLMSRTPDAIFERVAEFDAEWLIDSPVFVDAAREAVTDSCIDSYRVLESVGRERLLALSRHTPAEPVSRWMIQEAGLLSDDNHVVNPITGANAGGSRHWATRTLWSARVAQFWRSP